MRLEGICMFFPMTKSCLITMFHGQSMFYYLFSPHFYWYRHLRTFPGTQTSSITSCTAASSSQRSFPGKMPWCPKEIDVFCHIFVCIHCTTLHYTTLHYTTLTLQYTTLHYINIHNIYIYKHIYIYIQIYIYKYIYIYAIYYFCRVQLFYRFFTVAMSHLLG